MWPPALSHFLCLPKMVGLRWRPPPCAAGPGFSGSGYPIGDGVLMCAATNGRSCWGYGTHAGRVRLIRFDHSRAMQETELSRNPECWAGRTLMAGPWCESMGRSHSITPCARERSRVEERR